MTSYNSTYQAAVVAASAGTGSFSANKAPLARKPRTAFFQVALPSGTVVNDGDVFNLGSLGIPGCYVKPEGCRIRFAGTGSVDAKFTFQKVDVTGTTVTKCTEKTGEITSITAVVTGGAPTSTSTVSPISAPTQLVPLAYNDMLQLLVNYGTSTALSSSSTTTSSTTVTVSSTTGILTGWVAAGPGIPAGTAVASVTDSTHLVLTAAATATASSSATLTFSPPMVPATQVLHVEVAYEQE